MIEPDSEQQAQVVLDKSANQWEITADKDVIDLLTEFRRDLNDLIATYLISSNGITRMHTTLSAPPISPDNPDPMIHMGIFHIGSSDKSHLLAQWRVSEAREQTQLNGLANTKLGHQWIVFFNSLWEHEYRPRLAKVHGCEVAQEQYSLLGDVRLLRNDVIHHKGIAQSHNTGKCKTINWFQPGDQIRIGLPHLDNFMSLFPWQDLAAGPKEVADGESG